MPFSRQLSKTVPKLFGRFKKNIAISSRPLSDFRQVFNSSKNLFALSGHITERSSLSYVCHQCIRTVSSAAQTQKVNDLSPKVRDFVEGKAKICEPKDIHICDGSEAENKFLLDLMQKQGMIEPLTKYENW